MKKAIIDIAAVYWRNWHLSANEGVSAAAHKTISFVRGVTMDVGVDNVIVALDTPPYKRCDVYPEYKANRPQKNEAAIHEYKKAIEKILDDGVTTARCEGYEADDVIATLFRDPEFREYEFVVYGTDKDLLQCTDLEEPYSGKIKTPMSVLNVERDMVVDFLALIGDASDNIKGVDKVGPVTAAKMLRKHKNIAGIYSALVNNPEGFTPKTAKALHDAKAWIDTTRSIIRLSDDLELNFEKREKKKKEANMKEQPAAVEAEVMQDTDIVKTGQVGIQTSHEQLTFKQSLEPIGYDQLWEMSRAFIDSQLYEKFPTAEAVMVTIMRGRSLGIDATTSLDLIHVIKGKPSMSAAGMIALVKASPACEYFQCIERTAESCTWETKRKGNPKPTQITMTYEECVKISPDKSLTQLKNQPATMIMWKAGAALCRMEYPDVINGMYATEELQ